MENTNQVSEINPNSNFEFSTPNNVEYPMPPLVSSLYDANNDKLVVKLVVFIDSKNETTPVIADVLERNNELSFNVQYDSPEEEPTDYKAWYLEFEYSSETVNTVRTVITYLQDTDPRTSRGTYTMVMN